MKTFTKVLTAALALGGALTISGSASAQDWRGPGYGGDWRARAEANRYLADTTCSGHRAYWAQSRLQVSLERGQIDRWTAQRIQTAIDRVQYREAHECREGDYRAVQSIGREYNRIGDWIAREAASYRGNSGWGGNTWNGGYWRR